MTQVYFASAVRTPVGRAPQGSLKNQRPEDLAALVIRESLRRVPAVPASSVGDVIMGCALPEGPQGYNIARMAALRSGLPESVPGMTVNRLCASGLEAVALAADRISSGSADVIIAGGCESMSQIPMFGFRTTPNPTLAESLPDAYLPMGLTAENVAKQFAVTRSDQDSFALQSHVKAALAIETGHFIAECVSVEINENRLDPEERIQNSRFTFSMDETPRRDSTIEKLAQLKPAFHAEGSVTAGNSSPLSDGAAAVMLISKEKALQLNVTPMARFVSYSVVGLAPGIMGLGPRYAIPQALAKAGLTLDDIDLFEINEAFAAQALAVIRELSLPPDRVNVNGGAIALGHPLGASGCKLAVTLVHELKRRKARFGIVSLCVGGGMGAAAVIEALY